LLVGSVAEHVAETVSAPTLVVRNAEPLLEWLMRGRPLKVLCASDISESEEALSMAITKLVLLGPVDLECAHLVQTNAFLLQSSAWALENPDLAIATPEEIIAIENKVKQRFCNAVGIGPRTVYVRQALGNPAYDLVTIAREQKADLILVGSHHKHGLQRLRHPSFSRRVLAHAHTNVLCVHLGTEDLESRVSISLKKRTAGPVPAKA
jgi:nucleotide-binding universal stress UspA family protein